MLVLVKHLLSQPHNLSCVHYPHTLLKVKKKKRQEKSRQVMSVGWGDQFSPQQIHQNSFTREATTTRKLLNAGGGTQIPRDDGLSGLCPHGAPGTLNAWPGTCTTHGPPLMICFQNTWKSSQAWTDVHGLELWQPHCGPSTGSTPNTCWWCLLVVSVCLHSTTEQGSLNSRPLCPLMSGAEIRHERIAIRGGQRKQRKKERNHPEVSDATD